ncbi:MAG: DNA helicase RecG, partial [Candidatus Cloacimonetes bacterium]|nr:DNA helicase RecG [Candidatus Cloacimonadota bacterium]
MNPLDYEIQYLKGVGDFRAKLLSKLGINYISDLLEHFPRDYINRQAEVNISDLIVGENCAIIGTITSIENRALGRRNSQFNVLISDGNDFLLCTWFRYADWLT